MMRSFGCIMLLGVTLFMLSACGETQEAAPDASHSVPSVVSGIDEQAASTAAVSVPTYTVVTITSFPPFVMRDANGQTIGFDADVLNAIGEKQGFKLQFLQQPWQTVFTSLDNGERDIVTGAVVITTERKKRYDFSEPYLATKWMAVLKAQPDKNRLENFNQLFTDASMVFVTQSGSAGVPALKRLLDGRSNIIQEVDTQYLEIKAVLSGQADAAYDISGVLQYYVHTSEDQNLYGLTDENAPISHFGFALRKGRQDGLLQEINQGLAAIKADGTYQKIHEKWYGIAP
ncbi:MAG: transporter substrate-binding domain-containing protein [Neisseria sp.]|nr:transporter substrate-binding domain-containing protein [Neisseria sp.]